MQTIHWFLKNYPSLVQEMKNTCHHYDGENYAIYHAEGDVFTHTMCVYTAVQRESTDLKLAALLHDIGKVSTRKAKEDRVHISFPFHENVSMFEAIKILEHFEKDFPKEKIDKVKILKAINWHQNLHKIGRYQEGEFILPEEHRQWLNHFYGTDLDFYEFMVKLGRADAMGRIAEDMDKIFTRYEFLNDFIPEEMYHVKEGKPIAYILSGPQCTGKTTYARELMKNNDFMYISPDDIMTEHGKYAYNMVYNNKAVGKASAKAYDILKQAVTDRKNIIVDETNTDHVIRNRKASIIPDKHYHKVAVNMIAPIERIEKRNLARKADGKTMDISIIKAKMLQYELAGTDLFHEAKTILT